MRRTQPIAAPTRPKPSIASRASDGPTLCGAEVAHAYIPMSPTTTPIGLPSRTSSPRRRRLSMAAPSSDVTGIRTSTVVDCQLMKSPPVFTAVRNDPLALERSSLADFASSRRCRCRYWVGSPLMTETSGSPRRISPTSRSIHTRLNPLTSGAEPTGDPEPLPRFR